MAPGDEPSRQPPVGPFAFAQVDPEKEAAQREFERDVVFYEAAWAKALFEGQPFPDLSARIAEGFKLVSLNNDHNPGPVPFGHTSYTKEDVAQWKQTRRDWIKESSEIGHNAREQARPMFETLDQKTASAGKTSAYETEGAVVLENEFYRVEVDRTSGGVKSLVDKELGY